jgi:hypothetical protein
MYIRINPPSLRVKVTETASGPGIKVPLGGEAETVSQTELGRLVYYGYIYPRRYRLDREQGRKPGSYKLIEPDPWMIALAALMWEGIIQGLAWDFIKVSVHRALAVLRQHGVAPSVGGTKHARSKTRIGFSYAEYAEDGELLKDMFLGLEREFARRSEPERLLPTRPKEFESLRRKHFDEAESTHALPRKSKTTQRKRRR